MNMKFMFACVLALAGMVLRADVEIGQLFNGIEKPIWERGADVFFALDAKKNIFSWNDDSHTALAVNPRYARDGVTFAGIGINEMRIFFVDGKTTKIEANIFNRSDNRMMEKSEFQNCINLIQDALDNLTKVEGSVKNTSSLDGNYIYSRYWQNTRYRFTLRWSTSGSSKSTFQPEFISLTITPPSSAADAKTALKVTQNVADLKSKVKQNSNGDRYLDIPMVDQGAKSYCVNAACERVLKYYGSEVDQHVLAQLGKSSASGGTDMDQMLKSLQAAGAKLQFRCKELYIYKTLMSESGINHLIASYNAAASKLKKKKLSTNPAFWQYNAMNIIRALDPEVFKVVRTKDHDFKEFQRHVHENINNGTPVLWGVLLGIVKENDLPQVAGGHMRLIIGYDDKGDQVIYSDSWGKEHAFKKMSLEDAWTMTTMLVVCQPRSGGR